MPSFRVETQQGVYDAVVERGVLSRAAEWIPKSAGKLFVITTRDVWKLHGERLAQALAGRSHTVLFFPGGEERKRLAEVEALTEQMVCAGADRSSVVVAFGGGIVTDVAGFAAAIFMRGIPVLQVPTTLLAQVDAAVGGKTGVNLVAGKNLAGSFHQPIAVLIDPDLLHTLPEREYRAGLYEIIKCGVIRDAALFQVFEREPAKVLAQDPAVVERIIADSVRIKAEVVTIDAKEENLRRILNFGHTIGHALEAETAYARFLHGEAVAFGMRAASEVAVRSGHLARPVANTINGVIAHFGPIPPLDGIEPERLLRRLVSDKKSIQGRVHLVLPVRIGEATIVSCVDDTLVLSAIEAALA
ncbi:MAG TPA: 3-dehydroquinate synthase [Bryobacteraceae bacterium]|nr:3-dehydroquinate synthase [Bryobacteraceae bacterium]